MGERVKVAEVFELQMGKTPARDRLEYWNNGDHEWVSIKDLGAYDKYVGRTKETISELGRMESGIKPVPAGTLIMSFKLSLGKAAITTKETYTNEAIMAFLDKKSFEINLNYMWHQFRSKDWGRETNAAVKGKTLNKKSLGSVEIVVPSIEVQLGVATKLDRLLEQIEFARQEERLLDSLVKSQFVEMFGDPIANPREWPVSTIKETAVAYGDGPFGSNLKSSDYVEDGVRVIRLGNILQGAFSEKDRSFVSFEKYEKLKKYECKPGEVVIATLGDPILRACLVPDFGAPSIHKADCMYYETDKAKVLPAFAMNVINQPAMLQRATEDAHGQTRIRINSTQTGNLPIIVPPIELQNEFCRFVAEVDKSRFVARKSAELIMNMQALDIRLNARLQ
mgnify:CR=1 FL=1